MEQTINNRILQSSDDEFIINVGPQHPSTHGVLHLQLRLDGEEIADLKPFLGYIHRGIEKMCESLTYKQFIYLTSRMDYLSAHINNQACCLAIEKSLQVEVPERAKVIRTLMAELTRLASHQLWWGSTGLDMGAVSPFFYAFREREMILEIFEETCGSRLTMNYCVPGGVMNDIHPDFVSKVKKLIQQFKANIHEYDELLTGNPIFQSRTRGVGYLPKEDAISLACSGPVARASGISCDVRKKEPYDAYDRVEFEEIIASEGDCFARYRVRMKEMLESMKIIEQLIDNIPAGDYRAKIKGIIKPPAGEYFQRVETARGELGVFIVSDGSNKPYRVKFRTPNFSNLAALKPMSLGAKIGDLVAIMASLDLIIPDIDR
ncbi:MAG: NADH-quinone oxidoreductase subunit D [Bacteroidales bacterium]|nr:NADH-quinone oxidoreductase subunit D [Bacteroidales bacterium]